MAIEATARANGSDACLGGCRGEVTCKIGDASRARKVIVSSPGKSVARCAARSFAVRRTLTNAGSNRSVGCVHPTYSLDLARLLRVLRHIETHVEEDLGIEELADIACLSPFHFARMFRNSMGEAPHRYVSELRMARAKALLTETDRPLVEIALASRFSSQANFSRAFRQTTGQSPGAYRRALR